jgi:hypothetical protein
MFSNSRISRNATHILENHPDCKEPLPNVKKEWGIHKITIARPIGVREPSVICQGIHGNITGMRADIIICGDVEVPNTSKTRNSSRTFARIGFYFILRRDHDLYRHTACSRYNL